MRNINDYRKNFADLRDSILVEIANLIRKQPNWYMKIDDVLGKLIFQELNMQENEMIHSVTVKEIGGEEKEVVWVGVYEEDYFIDTEQLSIELTINLLEAMQEELE